MPQANEFGFERTGSLLAHSPEMGMPEDIANAALFLASDDPTSLTAPSSPVMAAGRVSNQAG